MPAADRPAAPVGHGIQATQAVAKVASDASRRRRFLGYPLARSAIGAYLEGIGCAPGDVVALPAYIGWSPREGSGVLDPLAELGLRVVFYRTDATLGVDLDHLQHVLDAAKPAALIVIHFFGRCDPHYPEMVAMSRRAGAAVLEDEAHAMLSDLVGGVGGRLGDAAVYSLHKLLPVHGGGVLVLNAGTTGNFTAGSVAAEQLWEHDLAAIAARRRANAAAVAQRLPALAGRIDPLWGDLGSEEVPQTFPVLVRGVSREHVYDAMNAAGYGVVSLYHTLVDQIPREAFPDSALLSRLILNLPVHQDTDAAALDTLVEELGAVVTRLSSVAPSRPV